MSKRIRVSDRPRRQASVSDLGVQSLTLVLLAQQGVIGLVLVLSAWWFGFDIAWVSAEPALAAVATCGVVWLYLLRYPGLNEREWLVAEAALIFGLLLVLTIILLPAQYAVAAWNRPLVDPWLAAADRLMGLHVPAITEWVRGHETLASLLAASYNSLAIQFILAIPMLVSVGRRDELWEYAYHFHTCAIVTLLTFAFWPAECVFNHYGFQSILPQDVFTNHFYAARSGDMRHLEFAAMEGLVSAPSFHMAGGLMITWAVRNVRWVLLPVSLLNAGLCSATVLTGAHYAIDTLLSVVLFALSVWSWRRFGAALLDRPCCGRIVRGTTHHLR